MGVGEGILKGVGGGEKKGKLFQRMAPTGPWGGNGLQVT